MRHQGKVNEHTAPCFLPNIPLLRQLISHSVCMHHYASHRSKLFYKPPSASYKKNPETYFTPCIHTLSSHGHVLLLRKLLASTS